MTPGRPNRSRTLSSYSAMQSSQQKRHFSLMRTHIHISHKHTEKPTQTHSQTPTDTQTRTHSQNSRKKPANIHTYRCWEAVRETTRESDSQRRRVAATASAESAIERTTCTTTAAPAYVQTLLHNIATHTCIHWTWAGLSTSATKKFAGTATRVTESMLVLRRSITSAMVEPQSWPTTCTC